MALKLRRRWTGVIRGELTSIKRRLNSLKNYNTRHPDYNFLSPAQLIIVQSMLDNVITPLLNQTVLR
jgi:hypothetical protein